MKYDDDNEEEEEGEWAGVGCRVHIETVPWIIQLYGLIDNSVHVDKRALGCLI